MNNSIMPDTPLIRKSGGIKSHPKKDIREIISRNISVLLSLLPIDFLRKRTTIKIKLEFSPFELLYGRTLD